MRDLADIYLTIHNLALQLESPAQALMMLQANRLQLNQLVAVPMRNRHVRVVVLLGDAQQTPPKLVDDHDNEFRLLLSKSVLDIFMVKRGEERTEG